MKKATTIAVVCVAVYLGGFMWFHQFAHRDSLLTLVAAYRGPCGYTLRNTPVNKMLATVYWPMFKLSHETIYFGYHPG